MGITRPLLVFFVLFSVSLGAQNELTIDKNAQEYYKIARKSLHTLKHKKSVIYAEKSLQLALKANNYSLVARNYNIIGLNYEEFSEPKKAIEFLLKGFYYAKKAKNDTLCNWFCTNIGGIYIYRKVNLNEGIKYYHSALEYSKKLKMDEQITGSTIDLAVGYSNLKRLDLAFNYLEGVRSKIPKLSSNDYKMFAYTIYAKYYENINAKVSENFYQKAIAESNLIQDQYLQFNVVDLYKDVADFYERKKNFSQAYVFMKKHDSLEDIVFDERKQNMLNKEFQSMKLGQVNDKILKIEYENKVNSEKLKQSELYITALIVGIALVVLVLFFISRGNKKLKDANAQLKIAKQESEATAKLKNQFISTVSHELRTPLYGVIGLTDILENENEHLKEDKYFSALKYSSKHLLSLINDVLDVYKIEEGKLEFHEDSIQLEFELSSIMESLQVMASKNNNTFSLTIASEVPKFILTDKTKLSQIIINLLSNAYKFTKNGVITINVFEKEQSQLCFEISDTGIGIPKEYLDKIFEKFVQVERNSTLQYQGTGLGLTIVKKTVESMGGEIQIESTEKIGTKVSFQIPLKTGQQTCGNSIDLHSNKVLNTISVLVVEDNHINQMVTRKMLEKQGITVSIAENGYLALEATQNQEFDIILMDINMPGMDGFETATAIREFNLQIPIIALTATDRHEIEKQLKKAKINDVIVKPFNNDDFINMLKRYA
ncbi:ATP-binding protein [Flavobacterium sp.]|uniref:ATP-binding protein n=1 Tax=Flavobacterium sp. TaxID=239 RepID=UPI003D137806